MGKVRYAPETGSYISVDEGFHDNAIVPRGTVKTFKKGEFLPHYFRPLMPDGSVGPEIGEADAEEKATESAEVTEAASPAEAEAGTAPDEEASEVLGDDEEAIRAQAKDAGIRNWHNKKIDRLKAELEEME